MLQKTFSSRKIMDMRPIEFRKARKTVTMSVRMTDDLAEHVDRIAEAEGVSRADALMQMIQWAVEAYAEQKTKKK